MNDIRGYLGIVCLLVLLAIIAAAVMTAAQVPASLVVTLVGGIMTLATTIMGFIAMIFNQQRQTVKQTTNVEEVKSALLDANEKREAQLQRIQDTQDRRDQQLQEIQKTSDLVYKVVSMHYGNALRSLAQVTQSFATMTKNPEDQKAADLAVQALKDEDVRQQAIAKYHEDIEKASQ